LNPRDQLRCLSLSKAPFDKLKERGRRLKERACHPKERAAA
jgi:hypothetical protein